eukprot:1977420-Alexandrium_andersonii.AAC.1
MGDERRLPVAVPDIDFAVDVPRPLGYPPELREVAGVGGIVARAPGRHGVRLPEVHAQEVDLCAHRDQVPVDLRLGV